ncbi:putative Acyl carrier protein [Cocos nucifera]|uniref:Acyl carrier protein n=1 Tax=Cocos nucifera TaxID=13894 RepID=A0A8K0IYT3_COCNU|nr:putative Acyl carrier protein [Cocos nucifera]
MLNRSISPRINTARSPKDLAKKCTAILTHMQAGTLIHELISVGHRAYNFIGDRNLYLFKQAKSETVQKVCKIVKKQLALSDDTIVTGESKFSSLEADSLDMVEIVMGLKEAFGISVEEESTQSITIVQDAADLIEKLVDAKSS